MTAPSVAICINHAKCRASKFIEMILVEKKREAALAAIPPQSWLKSWLKPRAFVVPSIGRLGGSPPVQEVNPARYRI